MGKKDIKMGSKLAVHFINKKIIHSDIQKVAKEKKM